MMRTLTTLHGAVGGAELRLVEYSGDSTHTGATITTWEVWRHGVCIATLTPKQLEHAAAWAHA